MRVPTSRSLIIATLIAALAAFWGCSSDDPTVTTPLPLSVAVAPSFSIVDPGAFADFDAILEHVPAGQSNDVIWSLSGTSCSGDACGTLFTLSGHSVRYFAPATAPASSAVRLIAAAVADPGVTAEVEIVVSTIRVVVTPDHTSLTLNASTSFTATITGDPADGGVTWTLVGRPCALDCGSLSLASTSSGEGTIYTAPDRLAQTEPPANQVTLHATSVTDPHIAGSAIVSLSAL